MRLPMLHLNGTSRDALVAQYECAREALEDAMAALRNAAPHPRDYYPLGDDAYREALYEHYQHLVQMGKTLSYLRAHIDHLTKEEH